MSPALPQSIGIGSVAGTALGTVLMAYAGYGEAAVYICAATCGLLFPFVVSRFRRAASRTSSLSTGTDREGWNRSRVAAVGQ